MEPKYSIIVGLHNQLKTLPILVESLANQTLQNFEVHFCDDGSDDGTEEFFAENDFAFPYQYHRQKRKGVRLAKNVNQGIRAARGEYCVFIMADSFPEINYLETLDEYANPETVICGIRINVERGGPGERPRVVELDYRLRKKLIPNEPVMILNQPWNSLTGNGLCIPTEALQMYGPWDEKIEGYGGEDTEIIGRLYFKGYFMQSVPSLILYHHYHKSNAKVNETNAYYVQRRLKKYRGY
jgi:GT2 family glycosyltransferase